MRNAPGPHQASQLLPIVPILKSPMLQTVALNMLQEWTQLSSERLPSAMTLMLNY